MGRYNSRNVNYPRSTKSPPIKMTVPDLIAALEGRRSWCKARDRRLTREHHAAEQAALRQYRDDLRAAIKLSYEEAAEANTPTLEQPACPLMLTPVLDAQLASLTRTSQQTLTIEPDDRWHGYAHLILTLDDDAAPLTPCADADASNGY